MFPNVKSANRPTTHAAIEAFERERGLVLPALYREFLLATNGGVPDNPTFPIHDMPLNPAGDVQAFFGVEAKWSSSDLAKVYDFYAGRIPHDIIPIAGNGGGDYVCLDLRNGGQRVAFWNQRHFWGTGEWRESDLYHVADSFAEFLASLRPNPY